jgi:Zn-dependent M28 family amino/carboxypeptidase
MRVFLLLAIAALASCSAQPVISPPPMAATPAQLSSAQQLLEDVRILSADDMEGRLVGSPGGAKARTYILGRLNEIGLAPALGGSFEHPFQFKRQADTLTGVNLLATIPGTGGSNRALIVMAHYDHVGVRNGEIFNGADDNASGVAALLQIATSMKTRAPLHDVIFAIVDGEEGGLRGARAMVADPAFKPQLDRTVLAVNFDMISRSDKNELYAAGAYHFPWLKPRIDAIAAAAKVTLKQGHDSPIPKEQDWSTQSDHGAFHQLKRPWVYFGVEDHPDYHKPTDDFLAIPQDFFQRSADTLELATRAFDRDLEAIAQEAGR